MATLDLNVGQQCVAIVLTRTFRHLQLAKNFSLIKSRAMIMTNTQ